MELLSLGNIDAVGLRAHLITFVFTNSFREFISAAAVVAVYSNLPGSWYSNTAYQTRSQAPGYDAHWDGVALFHLQVAKRKL